MKTRNSLIPLLLLFSSNALIPAASAADKVMWDNWYTMTLLGKTAYGYFNEKAVQKKDRVHVQVNLWKLEEGFINEEQVATFSMDNAEVTPLFFNVRMLYRASETKIDGTLLEEVQK